MELALNKPALQPLNDRLFDEKEIAVFVLRDDLIHPFVSGNKWRKLKYNLEAFQNHGAEYLVTFGGAFSNHIVATAAAGKELGIKTVGIIRGEEHHPATNSVLQFANHCGMKLIFVTREHYRNLRENNSHVISILEQKFPDRQIQFSSLFILPEGGSNDLAVKGCKEIIRDIPFSFDVICCACATGATLAGISAGLKANQRAIGIAVVNGEHFLEKNVLSLNESTRNFQIMHEYVFGGYAKTSNELDAFCNSFKEKNNIPVEPVYTGKLFYGIYNLVKNNFFEKGKSIIAIHTGGLFDFEPGL